MWPLLPGIVAADADLVTICIPHIGAAIMGAALRENVGNHWYQGRVIFKGRTSSRISSTVYASDAADA